MKIIAGEFESNKKISSTGILVLVRLFNNLCIFVLQSTSSD
ncbi:hypothetical protein [Spiroplasma endosymbiont of Cleonymus obscurus]